MMARSVTLPRATLASQSPGCSAASFRPRACTSVKPMSFSCWYLRRPRGSVKTTQRTLGSLSSRSRILSTCSWSSATTTEASQWSMTKATSARLESW